MTIEEADELDALTQPAPKPVIRLPGIVTRERVYVPRADREEARRRRALMYEAHHEGLCMSVEHVDDETLFRWLRGY
jgi:hypothetical protein